VYVPPRPMDPETFSPAMEWVELSGEGTLAAFTAVFIGPTAMVQAGYDRNKPYMSGVVQLAEGPMISAQILGLDAAHPGREHYWHAAHRAVHPARRRRRAAGGAGLPGQLISDFGFRIAESSQSEIRNPQSEIIMYHFDWIKRHAERTADKLALVDAYTGQQWTYAELDARINRLANFMQRQSGFAAGRPHLLAGAEQRRLFCDFVRLRAVGGYPEYAQLAADRAGTGLHPGGLHAVGAVL
jgi:hypothetical protein